MNRELNIARGEIELGTFDEAEVRELLREGFLLPSDWFWMPDMPEWRELSQLDSGSSGKARPAPFIEMARQKTAAAGRVAAAGASEMTRKLKSLAAGSQGKLTQAGTRMLQSFTPQIQNLVANQLVRQSLTRADAALRDDEFMRKLFGATYDCLPRPVYRFLTEEAFIQYCMTRRQELLGLNAGDSTKL